MTSIKTYKAISVSLPQRLINQLQSVAKKEHRSRSEIIRSLLRDQLIPARNPTDEEVVVFEYGENEFSHGRTIPLTQIPYGVRG